MREVPSVFLSSTFYDLRQVRADLRSFIEDQLCYRLLASEYDSFPVDPAVDTVENCRRRVESDADLFVLVIGSRYGSVPTGENFSVTNIEYIAARAKAIPIYAFMHRDVLALLPVWEANPEGNFAKVVDTPRIFEFISQVRSSDRVWSFAFDTAQDIIRALRIQFAYQMRDGLQFSKRLHDQPADLQGLRGNALRLASERPKGWQALLLAELLDQLAQLSHDRSDYERGYTAGSGEQISRSEIGSWISTNINDAERIATQLTATLNDTLNTACAQSDVPAIQYGARRVVAAYQEALIWANRLRRAHVPDELTSAIAILARYLDTVIEEIAGFSKELRKAIANLITFGGTRATVKLTFTIDPALSNAFHAEMERARRKVRW